MIICDACDWRRDEGARIDHTGRCQSCGPKPRFRARNRDGVCLLCGADAGGMHTDVCPVVRYDLSIVQRIVSRLLSLWRRAMLYVAHSLTESADGLRRDYVEDRKQRTRLVLNKEPSDAIEQPEPVGKRRTLRAEGHTVE